jgi:predicted Zn finger-like uncharacterized protein
MDVSCPKCQTVYEFDESRLRSGAVTLKCSQCQYLFRLEAPSSASGENQRRWMVRTAAGDILYFATFSVLHRWIMEGSVGPGDAISRTGRKWTALGQIGEFMPIFQVVESIARLSGQNLSQDPSSKPSKTGREDSGARARPNTPHQSAAVEAAPLRATGSHARADFLPTGGESGHGSPGQGGRRVRSMDTPAARTRAETPAPQGRSAGSAPRTLPPSPVQREISRPRVQTESSRSAPQAGSSSPSRDDEFTVGPSDDWTLGELEVAARPGPIETERMSSVDGTRPARTGLLLGTLALAATAFLAVWAWGEAEMLSSWWAEKQQPKVVSLGDPQRVTAKPTATPGRAEAEVIVTQAQAVVDGIQAELIGLAVKQAMSAVGQAIEPAMTASNRAYRPDLGTLIARGNSALKSGDAERARRLFHQAIELNRNSPEAITGLGWALLSLGSADAAAAQFQRALHRDGSHGDAYIGLGRAERSRGNIEAAIRAYETYLQRHPNGAQASIARFQSEQLREQLGR